MKRFLTGIALLALFACEYNPRAERFVRAARECTELYAKHALRANAAGDDCLVLVVRAESRLSDSAVESIHYGTGDVATYDGGVRQFLDDRGFRAVVYRDADGGLWTYGAITNDEVQSLRPCR